MIRHVAGVAEIVDDVDAAVRFYQDVLGLPVSYEPGADYATIELPGVLHFGIWPRSAAALATFGDATRAKEIPLGFTLGFEVDDVAQAAALVRERGWQLAQAPHREEWGQTTARLFFPSGALTELSETPWARRIAEPARVEGEEPDGSAGGAD